MPRGGARPGAGRPRKFPEPDAPISNGHNARPSLRAALGQLAAPTIAAAPPVAMPPPAPTAPLPPAPTLGPALNPTAPTVAQPTGMVSGESFLMFLSRRGVELFALWCEAKIRRQGFEANEADEEDLQRMVDQELRNAFPDFVIPWWIGIPGAAWFMYQGMRIGARPLAEDTSAPAADPASAPTDVPTRPPATPPTPDPPPAPTVIVQRPADPTKFRALMTW